LICTPENLEELTLGFLFSDGILKDYQDITRIKIVPQQGLIWVYTNKPLVAAKNFLKRYITTCCGKGRPSFYFVNDAESTIPLKDDSFTLSPSKIIEHICAMEERSVLFKSTGGAHGAALCDNKSLLVFFEDIGRHNAVDKIIGHCLLKKIDLSSKAITLTGRISSEILIKIAKIGIPIIISRSAPTNLALRLANELGVTVVGFARGEKFNVYTHPERIV
ncbi:MAG: formate dehydrogenase accessory sulfurtransferase FdhD, partial [Peptococcaceae bacterium]|nr:formate dehydrogenase accessory sulfurtransferase FdhD [Peptococcaceae bacterium]